MMLDGSVSSGDGRNMRKGEKKKTVSTTHEMRRQDSRTKRKSSRSVSIFISLHQGGQFLLYFFPSSSFNFFLFHYIISSFSQFLQLLMGVFSFCCFLILHPRSRAFHHASCALRLLSASKSANCSAGFIASRRGRRKNRKREMWGREEIREKKVREERKGKREVVQGKENRMMCPK
jgi:hypothetical protein